jgi:hypothetical protein
MQADVLKTLLTKYFEGSTSLEEEKLLRQYFTTQEALPQELLTYRNQFLLSQAMAESTMDTGELERKITEKIDALAAFPKPLNNRRSMYRFMAAASVTVLIGIAAGFFFLQQKPRAEDTFTDPQLAYHEAQKALMYVSQKMNRGIEPLSNVSKITTGTDKLKSLERMDESLGMLNLVSFINQSSNLKK